MSFERLKAHLQGISAITLTPFHQDGSINLEALRANARFLAEHDIETIVACGNTGEYYALSLDEAQQTATMVVEEVRRANKETALLAGVGYATPTAIMLARHAQEIGMDGIMIHQPVHPYLSEQGLVRYYTQIAEAVDIGVVLYVRDPLITPNVLKQVCQLPNVVGIKYAINNLYTFATAVKAVPEGQVVWVCGTAEGWAPFFWSAGARGFTSGLVNVAPRLSQAMLAALQSGDQSAALAVWQHIKPFEDLRARHSNGNNVPVVKEAMHQLGLCDVERWVRPPISELGEQERDEVRMILQQWQMA